MKHKNSVFLSLFLNLLTPSLAVVTLSTLSSCGTQNQFEKYEKRNKKQEAEKEFKQGNFGKSTSLLREYLLDSSDDYDAKILLSVSLMRLAGIDEFSFFDSSSSFQSANTNTGNNVSDWNVLGSFLPPATTQALDYVKESVLSVESIPVVNRNAAALYQVAFTQFTQSFMFAKLLLGDGVQISAAKIATLNAADSLAILSSLRKSKEASSGTQGNTKVSESIDRILQGVDSAPGATEEERLRNYLGTQSI